MNSVPNREAYLLLTTIMQRVGMRRGIFLARLAELGYEISDDAFTNWGRAGRAFPRNWTLLCAMVDVLRQSPHTARCTAAEALSFLSLVELPFTEIPAVASLFPAAEFHAALQYYLPARLGEPREPKAGYSSVRNTMGDQGMAQGGASTKCVGCPDLEAEVPLRNGQADGAGGRQARQSQVGAQIRYDKDRPDGHSEIAGCGGESG